MVSGKCTDVFDDITISISIGVVIIFNHKSDDELQLNAEDRLKKSIFIQN